MKRCPWCCTVPTDNDVLGDGDEVAVYWVRCPHCEAFGPLANTRAEAIREWNTLPDPD